MMKSDGNPSNRNLDQSGGATDWQSNIAVHATSMAQNETTCE